MSWPEGEFLQQLNTMSSRNIPPFHRSRVYATGCLEWPQESSL
jgi:hypothetical protein